MIPKVSLATDKYAYKELKQIMYILTNVYTTRANDDIWPWEKQLYAMTLWQEKMNKYTLLQKLPVKWTALKMQMLNMH